MSGDVQPRKRKDKKKKKDDLGIEEPRGTAAALGEGDVFMHSHHDHGTGGHWCAKVIFFSLLAVLVTLIGLIILENRGLSELEANSVESRYSGVLDGWIEEGHDDDHHDEHTLELNHHDDEDDDDDDHSTGVDNDDDHDDDENEHDDEDDEEQSHEADDEDDDDERNQDNDDERNQDDDDDDGENLNDDDDDSNEGNDENDDDEQDEADQEPADSQQDDDDDENQSDERNLDTAEDEDEVEEPSYRRYYRSTENQANDDDEDDDDDNEQKADENDDDQSLEKDDDDQSKEPDNGSQENDDDDEDDAKNVSQENDDDDDEEKHLNTNEENDNENSEENDQDEDDEDHADHNDHNEDDSDVELEHIEDEVFDDDVSIEAPARRPEDSAEVSKEAAPVADADDDEVELLEPDDVDDLPEELPIPVPKGRPLVEVEESASTEKPQDTLADEEEYERQQEALRKEKEQASQGMWLKLVVGGALLVATQAVLRRATAPRENEDEVNTTREETPLSDRRMTLIDEPVPPPVTPKPQEVSRPVVQKEVIRQAPVVKSAPPPPPPEEEDDEEQEIIVSKDIKEVTTEKETIDKELYSDEEEEVEEEEEEEKEEPPKPIPISKPIAPTKEPLKPETPKPIEKKEPPKVIEKEPTPEDDDDVEIIEEEDIDEDLEEEEEDISDVDDAELLTRLEAKYGRLPEPERPGRKKDGGNSIEDEWPGEPSDAYWRDELDHAERDLRQGEWTAAAERASARQLHASARARYVVARALDSAAEAKRDNGLLTKAVAAYLELLKMNQKLSDKKLIEVTDRALDRMKFRGNYLGTEPVYRLLIRRFPDDPIHRNNLTISFLMANRVDLAEEVIKETLNLWPSDRLALAHSGFILKTLHNKLEEAIDAFSKALEGDTGPANEPRFYYHLGDALLLLGRFKEAHEVHKRGAKLGHFLSPAQRSLYNVERLKSKPWWEVEKTPYARLARALEKSWKEILKEGLAAQALYEKEKEGLKERGEWSQLDLFVRGREVPNRCSRAPVTCSVVRSEVAASGCRRGQVKFSLMEAGTHVRPHVGPTNCRLRMHLGLTNTKDTYLRVDKETRQWQIGKVLMFDDSFEHEVWHNGTGARLVLIVDVWHPDLTRTERAQLPAI